MKKLLAIAAVSVLTFSACSGGSSTTNSTTSSTDKTANLVGWLVDSSCATAKYDGKVPDAESATINKKYGFSTETEIKDALKAATADKANIEDQAAPQIEAKCKDDFAKGGVDAKSFLDFFFQ